MLPNKRYLDSSRQVRNVNDYRSQLLLGAAESASRVGDLREVAVHDIMAGLNRQRSRLFGTSGRPLDRALRGYALIGLLVGIGGLLFFAVREIVSGRSLEQQLTQTANSGSHEGGAAQQGVEADEA